jgi:hypothetical protein
MRLTETSTLWGNLYRRRYYLDGRRIPEAEADRILKRHHWENDGFEKRGPTWRTHWNIGPRVDAPPLTDHPDCA